VSCRTVDVLCILLFALNLTIIVTIVPVKTTSIARYAAIDLYTHQPDGSNGRGFNQSSDPVDPGSYVNSTQTLPTIPGRNRVKMFHFRY